MRPGREPRIMDGREEVDVREFLRRFNEAGARTPDYG